MAYANDVKRDCIFYEEYRAIGATMDLCAVNGSSWEDTGGCRCNDCPNYISADGMRRTVRKFIKEMEEI